MNSFEDLDTWKCAREFRIEIRLLVSKFPSEEKYRLTDQIIRSCRSVTANIAERFGRFIGYLKKAKEANNTIT